ncbi:phospholipase/carboxylesterase family protein [Apodospora peruviana]|uniref:Phospholipase/carboxylesterase family protein n=1 Tax=Apodospora peruviana TaxID=516989 RepID=A0AAE0IKY3_9PEZI|nr:phospholipase/carboxylesterase family protein [Apodospora peruviana]
MPMNALMVATLRAQHTHTVVFLHGRGDNPRSFASSLAHWRDSRNRTLADAFPSFRWVFPTAPMRKCASLPDTIPQWFDVWNVRDFAEREELQSGGLREVVPAIRRILADEAALLGGRWDRVVLAGISMGCATSVHTLFNLDVVPAPEGGRRRLGAFMGFSGRCPFAGRSSLAEMRAALGLGADDSGEKAEEVLRNTPMLLEHCVDDPLVLIQNGRGLRDTLRVFGAQVTWKEYPDGGHWFNGPAGMDDAINFLNKYVVAGQAGISDEMDMS